MLGTNAPNQWEMTRSFALNVATGGTRRAQRRAHPAHPARAAGPGGRAQRDRGHRHAGLARRPPADLRAGGPGRLDAAGTRFVADRADRDGAAARDPVPDADRPPTSPRRTRSAEEDPTGGLGEPARPVGDGHRADVLRPAGRLGGRPPRRSGPSGQYPLAIPWAPSDELAPGHRPTSPRSPRTGAFPRRRPCCGCAPASWPPTPSSPVRPSGPGWRSCWPTLAESVGRGPTGPGRTTRSPGRSRRRRGSGHGPRVVAGDVRRPRGAARRAA